MKYIKGPCVCYQYLMRSDSGWSGFIQPLIEKIFTQSTTRRKERGPFKWLTQCRLPNFDRNSHIRRPSWAGLFVTRVRPLGRTDSKRGGFY